METRSFPYIWVSWITGLLAGDDHCEWAAWFKAHHQRYDKVVRGDGARLAQWQGEHATLVRQLAAEARDAGYTPYLESQNKFELRGRVAVLAGKADLVKVRLPDLVNGLDPGAAVDAVVVDAKTGAEKAKDIWQVFLYMRFLPLVHDVLKPFAKAGKLVLHGEVAYNTGRIEFGPREITESTAGRMTTLIEKIAAATEPQRVPSAAECAYCDIGRTHCPVRVESAHIKPEDQAIVEEAGF